MGRTALVLGGGGARGAYEAGVLRWVATRLPSYLKKHVHFDIVVGTSAGAINGAFLAGHGRELAAGARAMAERWETLGVADVYRVTRRRLVRTGRSFLSRPERPSPEDVALVDTAPLDRLVREWIRWDGVRDALAQRHVEILAVTATEISTSRNVVFVQGARQDLPLWHDRNQFVRPQAVTIGPEHVLASAAIPLLFPPRRVEGCFYADGGLGQNTPLRPALRLGADKLFVLSLRTHRSVADCDAIARTEGATPPTWPQMVGKTMDAVLLDRSSQEVERLDRINGLLRWGRQRFGEEFVSEVNRFLSDSRAAQWKPVRALLIEPSRDVARIALDVANAPGFGDDIDGLTGRVLRSFARATWSSENDALSYLLFDRKYLAELVRLGEDDARARHDEICEFFADDGSG